MFHQLWLIRKAVVFLNRFSFQQSWTRRLLPCKTIDLVGLSSVLLTRGDLLLDDEAWSMAPFIYIYILYLNLCISNTKCIRTIMSYTDLCFLLIYLNSIWYVQLLSHFMDRYQYPMLILSWFPPKWHTLRKIIYSWSSFTEDNLLLLQ